MLLKLNASSVVVFLQCNYQSISVEVRLSVSFLCSLYEVWVSIETADTPLLIPTVFWIRARHLNLFEPKLPSLFFFVLKTRWRLQIRARKKKTEALFFSLSVSPSCPSSFRLFAGSETRQNERMWDRQTWNGGQGLRGVRDFVHICLRCVCERMENKKCFLVLSYWNVCATKIQYISLCIWVFVSTGPDNKVENSFWNSIPSPRPSTIPPILFHMSMSAPACLHLCATLISGGAALSTSLYGRHVVTTGGATWTEQIWCRAAWNDGDRAAVMPSKDNKNLVCWNKTKGEEDVR